MITIFFFIVITGSDSSDLDLDSLGLLGLRRRQLLNRNGQDSILTDSTNSIRIGILRQHELPHKLPNPPLHPQILRVLVVLFLPLPLPADEQNVVVLDLDLDLRPGMSMMKT